MKKTLTLVPVFVLTAAWLTFASTGELTEILKKAEALYDQGKYSEAIAELNFAIAHIQSRQMEQYETIFPEPLTDWSAEDVESQVAGMNMMGGGISMSRNYSREDGASVTITMVSDSPLMSSIMMAFGNPLMLGGKKAITVKGEKAVEEWNASDQYGKIQIVIDNRALITVEGSGLEKKEDITAYAGAIDFARLRVMMKGL